MYKTTRLCRLCILLWMTDYLLCILCNELGIYCADCALTVQYTVHDWVLLSTWLCNCALAVQQTELSCVSNYAFLLCMIMNQAAYDSPCKPPMSLLDVSGHMPEPIRSCDFLGTCCRHFKTCDWTTAAFWYCYLLKACKYSTKLLLFCPF